MTIGEAFKFAMVAQLLLIPLATLIAVLAGCFIAAVLPAVVHQWRYGGWFGWCWAIPYSFFWLFGLSWITLWGLLTAPRSAWLTRELTPDASPCTGSKLLRLLNVTKVFTRSL